MLTLDKPRDSTDVLFDVHAVTDAELAAIAKGHSGSEQGLATRGGAAPQGDAQDRPRARRSASAAGPPGPPLRRAALPDARRDHPHSCSSFVILHLYPSENPTEAERMAIIATGGYGRGCWRPAPTSICCSCCRTSRRRGAKSVAEAILYCLWDLGLKVGHATRTVSECIRQATRRT